MWYTNKLCKLLIHLQGFPSLTIPLVSMVSISLIEVESYTYYTGIHNIIVCNFKAIDFHKNFVITYEVSAC